MILTFANQKGGVGKTTASVFVAQYLNHNKGRALLIDLDPQANSTRAILGPDSDSQTSVLLKDGIINKAPASEIVIRTELVDVIPATESSLYELDLYLTNVHDGVYRLADFINDNKLESEYDFIVIDTPPNLGRLTTAALVATEYIVIPVEADIFPAEGMKNLFNTIEKIRRFNSSVRVLGVFINVYEHRSKLSEEIIKQFYTSLNSLMFKSTVRRDVALREAIALSQNIYSYAPRSRGAQDIRELAEEILARATRQNETGGRS